MQPRTATTLGELRPGDRFHFATDKTKQVHEVTGQLKTQAEVNTPLPASDTYQYKYPLLRKHTLRVIFLRHTQESINKTDALTGIV